MRRPATPATVLSLLSLVSLLPLTGCGTITGRGFAEPNALMAKEIRNRVNQIPYQHRQELLDNLLWLATKAGEQAIPTLLQGLQNREPKVRSSCAWVLCRIGDRRVIPYLEAKGNDPHESVRLEVARSLIYLGDLKQVPTLIKGLDSPLLPVRYNCHMALKDATKRDFGYDHLSESDSQRKKAVLAWWKWWGEQSGDPWFAKKYAQDNGLATPGQPPVRPVPPMPGPVLPVPPNTKDNTKADPFKQLPEFEEIDLGGNTQTDKTPQPPKPAKK
jgi:HEAT repeats